MSLRRSSSLSPAGRGRTSFGRLQELVSGRIHRFDGGVVEGAVAGLQALQAIEDVAVAEHVGAAGVAVGLEGEDVFFAEHRGERGAFLGEIRVLRGDEESR